MNCTRDRDELTAHADGEVRGLAWLRLEVHLARCGSCRAEMAERSAVVESQRRALSAPVEVDTERLLAESRAALAALGAEQAGSAARANSQAPPRSLAWVRFAFAAASLSLALLLGAATLVVQSGGWRPALVALGVEPAPRQLVRQADMFRDYEIIRELEFLEFFDAVAETPLEDERAAAELRHYG